MKRVLMLLLALCLTVSFAACGGGAANNDASAANTVEKGTVSGKSYTNGYFNLRFDMPDTWMAYSTEKIAEMNGFTKADFEGTMLEDIIAQNSKVYLFMAADPDTGDNVSIVVSNKGEALSEYTDEEIINAIEDAYWESYDIVEYEPLEIDFCGEKKTVLSMTVNAGIAMHMHQIFIRPEGDYYLMITVTAPITDPLEIDKKFSKLR